MKRTLIALTAAAFALAAGSSFAADPATAPAGTHHSTAKKAKKTSAHKTTHKSQKVAHKKTAKSHAAA